MKKLLLTLIVSLAFCGSIFAQHPDTHWPGFVYSNFQLQGALYASLMIDGEPVDINYENWDQMEVAAFVGDEMRMTAMFLTDEYVLEYDELFPTLNAEPIYYTTPGDTVTFKMYNHATGVEYDVCQPVIWNGDPITILTGEQHWEGFDDPDHPLMLNFTGGEPQPTTFTKTIEAVGSDNWEGGKGGYYLIASPLADAVDPATEGMNMITDELGAEATSETSTYDLYWFNQGEDLEWQNYRTSTFNLENGKGYLYASKGGTTLTFTGNAYAGDGTVELSYNGDANWPGWNLVGNPFTSEAYADRDYYALQNGSELVPTEGNVAVGAMEGIFVVAANENDTEMTFSTTAPNKRSSLSLNVSRANRMLDRTIVNFGGNTQLPKFQLRSTSTKVYIPVEGSDYAIVSAEAMGEMPVNFKAEKSGSYTISAKGEEVNFTYLHLIDNMTGADVDLLSTPSYSFDASTTDYESRFRLLFATGSSEDGDNFGFVNGAGNLSIYGIEGEATLQVMDVNGRVLSTETFSGSYEKSLNVAAGIYMLRLTNGDNVRVQKMVIR